jgi:hypothetical protein
MTPNEAATVPTEAAILHLFRRATDPKDSSTASRNSTANCVSAETLIEAASSTAKTEWSVGPAQPLRQSKWS